MDRDLSKLIDEAIHMELHIGDLYLLFSNQFPEESDFWGKLAKEEENHATLLCTLKQMGDADVEIPKGLLPDTIEELIKSNLEIQKAYEAFEKKPDRTRAFQFALRIENCAGEMHYNTFMTVAPPSPLTDIFRKLNGDDVDHASRINEYMLKHRIPKED
jgi:hypothetical protein